MTDEPVLPDKPTVGGIRRAQPVELDSDYVPPTDEELEADGYERQGDLWVRPRTTPPSDTILKLQKVGLYSSNGHSTASPLRAIPVNVTLANPPPEPEPLAAGLVNQGDRVVMGAGRAWNKSLFVLQLAHKLAEGDGLFLRDFLVKRPCRVLICQGEVTAHQSFVRWTKLVDGEGVADGVDEMFDSWKLRTIRKRRRDPVEDCFEEWPESVLDPRFEDVIAEGDYDLFALDPWASFYTGNENSNDETEAALDRLTQLSDAYRTAIWINHHFSQRGMSDKLDPEDAWRGASRLADWASTRITLLPHFTPRQAQKRGLSRIEARRYMDVRFLTRGAPIADFSLHRRDDLWLERWEDDTPDEGDHVEELVGPIVEVVTTAALASQTDLAKKDVVEGLRAAGVSFDDNDVGPAIIVAAKRGVIQASKPNSQRWQINAVEAKK